MRRLLLTRRARLAALVLAAGLVATLSYAGLTIDDSVEIEGGLVVNGPVTGIQMPAAPGDPTDAATRQFVNDAVQQSLQHVGPFGDLSMGAFVSE